MTRDPYRTPLPVQDYDRRLSGWTITYTLLAALLFVSLGILERGSLGTLVQLGLAMLVFLAGFEHAVAVADLAVARAREERVPGPAPAILSPEAATGGDGEIAITGGRYDGVRARVRSTDGPVDVVKRLLSAMRAKERP